jgi:hypothetical protein
MLRKAAFGQATVIIIIIFNIIANGSVTASVV